MKKKLVLLALSSLIVTSAFAQNQYAEKSCQRTFLREANDRRNNLVDSNWIMVYGAGGVIAGSSVGVALAASTLVPHMLVGAALVAGTAYGIDQLKAASIERMVSLINDSYDFQKTGAKGKTLLKLEKSLIRNGAPEVDSNTLTSNIIRGNEDGSLCSLYTNFAQLKQLQEIESEIKCLIKVPKSTSDSMMNSLQKKYGGQGVFITDTSALKADFVISNKTNVERESISKNYDLRTEKDYYVVSANNNESKTYYKKKRSMVISKNQQVQYFGTNDNKNSVLKKIVGELVSQCK